MRVMLPLSPLFDILVLLLVFMGNNDRVFLLGVIIVLRADDVNFWILLECKGFIFIEGKVTGGFGFGFCWTLLLVILMSDKISVSDSLSSLSSGCHSPSPSPSFLFNCLRLLFVIGLLVVGFGAGFEVVVFEVDFVADF